MLSLSGSEGGAALVLLRLSFKCPFFLAFGLAISSFGAVEDKPELNFRVLTSSTQPIEKYTLIITDSEGSVVSEHDDEPDERFPPEWVEFDEISGDLRKTDTYAYRTDVVVDGQTVKGKTNNFRYYHDKTPEPSLSDFQVGGIGGFQKGTGGNSFSPQLSWNPTWMLNPDYGLRGNVAANFFNLDTGGRFFAAELQVLVLYFLNQSLGLEAGAGTQTWFKVAGTITDLLFSFNVVLRNTPGSAFFLLKDFTFIDRFFAGYSYYAAPATVHQFKIGVGLNLF